MPRKPVVEKRAIFPDGKYNSVLVTKFINAIMRHGKKQLARNIVYAAFDLVDQKFKARFSQEHEEHTESDEEVSSLVFHKAVENAQPRVEVRSSRLGGGTYRVPRPIKPGRGLALAFSFVRKAALKRKANTKFERGDRAMAKLLALEIGDAYENKGGAVKMCYDMHRSAKANQAYVQVQFQSPQELKI